MLVLPLLLIYAVLAILFGMGMMFMNTLQAKVASVPNSQVSQSHVDIDWDATTVDSVPNLQPEAMQPHVNLDCHASEVDSVRDLHPEAMQLHVNLGCHASEADSVCDLHPEAPQSDVDADWGAIRHLWSD